MATMPKKWLLLAILCAALTGWASLGQPPTKPMADDFPLVERVIAARKQYQFSLEQLREFYRRSADVERARWVEEELIGYHRITKRAYILELDVPPPTLRPEKTIPEATDLFRRAVAYKMQGSGTSGDDNLRRSELLFQQLLATYPQSDMIDDSAFHLGEIYEGRVFNQYRRAAMYYERTFQWNPNTESDARLRAARLYDKTLLDRPRAVQLYRDVVNRDSNQKRVDEANRRLRELAGTAP
jgi:tetratricopeptide (TPR) repeat protein